MKMQTIARLTGVLLAVLATTSGAQDPRQQDVPPLEARYKKTEYRVPMRDGKQLFTVVYEPRDTTRRYAVMMTRTPYSVGPYGPAAYPRALGPSQKFADAGFIFVYQDVRGRFMSEGDFVHMTPWKGMAGAIATDESTDAYDTIDWVLSHVPRNTGRVGIWGVSYPGFFTAAALVNAHPALKAASPQAPQADWFMGDDVHHHGTFWLTSAFEFFTTSGRARSTPTPTTDRPARFSYGTDDGYAFFLAMGPLSNADKLYLKGGAPFWNDMMAHGTEDAFWQARKVAPHLEKVTPAVLTVSGWYDANNLHGALRVHEAIGKQSPSTSNRIVLGPWSHGQWARGPGDALGDLTFGSNTSDFFRDSIQFPFFAHYLSDNAGSLTLPHATAFETGTNRWRTFDAWPPKNAAPRSLYLQAGGKLSFSAPPPAAAGAAYDEYVSDPANPVPFLADKSTGMRPDYMARDQRFGSARPDVLVYTSDPLDARRHDRRLHSANAVRLHERHRQRLDRQGDRRRSGDGFQHLVRGDAMRGKFRNSYSKPEPFVPGKVERVAFFTRRRAPHVQARPHDRGRNPEHVVPARRPQSANVRRHLQRQAGRFHQGDGARLSSRRTGVADRRFVLP